MDDQLVLDANAVAGELFDLFGAELTAAMSECGYCGMVAAIGTLRAWTRSPGVVLRCSACDEVVVRWSRVPTGIRIEVRAIGFPAFDPQPPILPVVRSDPDSIEFAGPPRTEGGDMPDKGPGSKSGGKKPKGGTKKK